jgi:hypothetical protein
MHNTVLSRVDERFALSLRYYPAGSSVELSQRAGPGPFLSVDKLLS